MSQDVRLAKVLDAAYGCFVRHGVRKTTMEDIAHAAGISRPAVYQYVRSKDDAYRRLAAKLALTQRLCDDSPYAGELVGPGARVSAELERGFLADLTDLLVATIT